MNKKIVKRVCSRFTLVELLAVCLIISVLAAIGVKGYSYAQYKIAESRTKALIARVELALENCKAKYGYYLPQDVEHIIRFSDNPKTDPVNINNNENKDWILTEDKHEAYIDDFLRMLDVQSAKFIQKDGSYILDDGNGNYLFYACPGKVNTESFDLYSLGADGGRGLNSSGSDNNTHPFGQTAATLREYVQTSDDIANFK